MARAGTWLNSDGLVIGYGRNVAENIRPGEVLDFGHNTVAKAHFDSGSTFGATGVGIMVPAGCSVKNVYIRVLTPFAGGTSLAFGDAATPAGWVTAAQGAVANLTPAGTLIQAGGTYAIATGTSSTAPKPYNTATMLYFTAVGTFTAGRGYVVVEFDGPVN